MTTRKKRRRALDILDEITEVDKHYVLETLLRQDRTFSKTTEKPVRERVLGFDRKHRR